MGVLIGIDPHKATNAVAAIDERGELLGYAVFSTDRAGLRSLRRWGKRFPERRWAVEGAGGLGRPVALRLVGAGETVVDVPAKLSSRARLLATGNARKNDRVDAFHVALAALGGGRLAEAVEEEHSETLRMLSERREDLVKERTRTLNRLHASLRDLLPGGAPKKLSTQGAARVLRGVRPRGGPARTRRRLAADLLRDVRRLDRQLRELELRIREAVEEASTGLTRLFGVGPILAAKILEGERRDPLSHQGSLRLLHRHGTHRGLERRGGTPQALAGRQPEAQPRPALDRHLPGATRHRRTDLLPAQARRGQVPEGGAQVPQAADLRRRLQAATGRPGSGNPRHCLTQRSLFIPWPNHDDREGTVSQADPEHRTLGRIQSP
jgi:transposase